jgi:hypothetical protein
VYLHHKTISARIDHHQVDVFLLQRITSVKTYHHHQDAFQLQRTISVKQFLLQVDVFQHQRIISVDQRHHLKLMNVTLVQRTTTVVHKVQFERMEDVSLLAKLVNVQKDVTVARPLVVDAPLEHVAIMITHKTILQNWLEDLLVKTETKFERLKRGDVVADNMRELVV